MAKTFICIADASKLVPILGQFRAAGGGHPDGSQPRRPPTGEARRRSGHREGVLTDNGNIILDVHNLRIDSPVELEEKINAIVGVVTNGLFAARPADLLLLGTADGVKTLKA